VDKKTVYIFIFFKNDNGNCELRNQVSSTLGEAQEILKKNYKIALQDLEIDGFDVDDSNKITRTIDFDRNMAYIYNNSNLEIWFRINEVQI
jgi:hypothetical protein